MIYRDLCDVVTRMRINARLDDERSEKLKQLQAETNLSATEVLKRAIDLLYTRHSEEPRRKLDLLVNSDFVGCATGDEDLSTNYKADLIGMNSKHGPG